jgi:serine/threonine protein kinase
MSASPVGRYLVKQELARGRSGVVELATSSRGSPVVVKRMPKKGGEARWVANEIRAGEVLKNKKGIVKIREHYEDADNDYVVADYVRGQDLFVFMQKREFKPLDERKARRIIKRLAQALLFIHKKGISHKDIKLENICLDRQLRPTLIDFGFCEFAPPDEKSVRWDGTPEYASPEILLNLPFNSQKSDVYSLGVVLFILLTGLFPFELKKRCKILQQGGKPRVDWSKDYYPLLSEPVKDLIDAMLETEPEKRIGLEGVLNSPWMKKRDVSGCLPKFNIKSLWLDVVLRSLSKRSNSAGAI